jgi:hypothetical protein
VAELVCRVIAGERAGWRALTLTNGELAVTLLPDKGGDIVELVHLASGVDALFHAPWGLQPPGAPPRDGSDGHAFLENYGGGWQALFPSAGDATTYRGAAIPFHGEVATLPWNVRDAQEGGAAVVSLDVDCRATPLRLARTLRLDGGSATLVVEETATNTGGVVAHAVWGQHVVVGPPFLEAGCRLDVPAGTIETIPDVWEETARLEPGQRSPWPDARLRGGGTVDLREVPGTEAASHDDVYLTGLTDGFVTVRNPRLGLAFRLDFDQALFRWVISWQPYGGAVALPLSGSYALGVEPWTSRLPLAEAVAAGEALELAPGASLSTVFRATLAQAP